MSCGRFRKGLQSKLARFQVHVYANNDKNLLPEKASVYATEVQNKEF